MRRLVICADGTWNRPDENERDGVDTSTNVAKLARVIRPVARDASGRRSVTQVAYYHRGVGTGDAIDKALGGAMGKGIDDNILDCYRFLVHNYTPGDELYLFGFSRGAYTVRSLAGLIRNSGLLRASFDGMVDEAYNLYRDRNPEKHPNADAAVRFRQMYSYEPDITCVGVWDTVGALGIPVGLFQKLFHDKYDFHDVQLSSHVKNAFHALAIDERRKPFAPTLWEQPKKDEQTNWLEQAWFAGVHSNVGGGYPDKGLSDIAFRWMLDRVAARTGLQFDDDLLAKVTSPNAFGRLYDSMNDFYRTLGPITRAIDARRADNATRGVNTWEYVHESAYQRHTSPTTDIGSYAPEPLKSYLAVDPHVVARERVVVAV